MSNKMLGSVFDPSDDLEIREHFRPHWSQAGAIVFMSFRAADSIPEDVLVRWEQEKKEWLHRQGLPNDQHWSIVVPTLETEKQEQFKKEFSRCRDDFLDSCHGRCLMRRPTLAKIVADSLLHFDGIRYRMGDFVVMPNHVHMLVSFPNEDAMLKQCDSWLHYTAFKINQAVGQKGKFWQQEPFDHLVRSLNQYEYLRQYIADNPQKASLKQDEFIYRRYDG